jgi:hypothetical protein
VPDDLDSHVICAPCHWACGLADSAFFGQFSEEFVAPQCPVVVLVSALPDELGDVGMVRGVSILQVLVVGLSSLEGVILDADQVVDDVVRHWMVLGYSDLLALGVGALPRYPCCREPKPGHRGYPSPAHETGHPRAVGHTAMTSLPAAWPSPR